ncbi:ROK family protein [Nakamurella sp. UYEF19]|uniref:ROK family protein n=1 Tax=Nakamurella sp. UYEF19 TaxID=1756392 RepID=UPI003390C5B8
MRDSSTRAIGLLRLVHDRPGITRADAARSLAVGTGAAAELVAGLVSRQLLSEQAAPPSGGRGRPTTLLGPHPGGPLVVAVSITYADWRIRAIEIGGRTVDVVEGFHAGQRADEAMDELSRATDRLRRRLGSRVRGLGVSAPGIVRDGRLIDATTLGWRDVDLTGLARREEVFVAGNDATLAASAESSRGNAAGSVVALHLRVDAGLGGGVVDGGFVSRGATGVAGEFGHMPFGDPEVRCPCGSFGCWGNSVDGLALARLLHMSEPADPVSFFHHVVGRARAGDIRAGEAVGTVSGLLGRGIAGLVNGLDPDVITVGGLGTLMLDVAGDRLEQGYRAGLMTFRRSTAPPILPSALGEDGPLIGAAEETWAGLWGPLVASPHAFRT